MNYQPQLATLVKQRPRATMAARIKYDGYRIGCGSRRAACGSPAATGRTTPPRCRRSSRPPTRCRSPRAPRRRGGGAARRRPRELSGAAAGAAAERAAAQTGSSPTRSTCCASTATRSSRCPSRRARHGCRRCWRSGTRAAIRYADHVVGHGPAFFEEATRLGVEGIVSKRRDGVYQPGAARAG